ncbi:MAG: PEP-CTERM sorting domain-containing protein [Sedimentisphaerales bacterium]|nr:PEP-CTERM sorting domain-containing protein [Sedimentisphaerales bacterium]
MNRKRLSAIVLVMALLGGFAASLNAAVINGQNWADSVSDWSGGIQNYGLVENILWSEQGADPSTWWVTGAPDADVDGNGNAWDTGDNDYVAGWKGAGAAHFILYYETALVNIPGNDLAVKVYGGPNCEATVLGSTDDGSYTQIGIITGAKGQIPGKPGFFHEVGATGLDRYITLDFGTLDNLHYIKFERSATGSGSGMFFDAAGSVPEPLTIVLLAVGGLGIFSRRKHMKKA